MIETNSQRDPIPVRDLLQTAVPVAAGRRLDAHPGDWPLRRRPSADHSVAPARRPARSPRPHSLGHRRRRGPARGRTVLVDRYGRVATDLRVSLTDRCNLRCAYCMPAEGLDWLPSPDILTDDEVVRLVRIAVERLGVRQVRFTGGEPLLRKGLVDIVRGSARLRRAGTVADDKRHRARPAGPIARRCGSRPDQRFAGHPRPTAIRGDQSASPPARRAGRARRRGRRGPHSGQDQRRSHAGINDDEAPRLLRWALDRGYEMRFIEQMPLDAAARLGSSRHGHCRGDPRPAWRRSSG